MLNLKNTRPVWAEINLDNLAHNIKEVRRITKKETLITAVVKANGYGHGAAMAAKTFLENGGDRLAVATLSEAIELRSVGIEAPILILGYTPVYQMGKVVENNITQTVYTWEQAVAISNAAKAMNKAGKIHIKIDTGMSRLGFLCNETSIIDIKNIYKLPNIEIEGIYTHFAVADEKDKKETVNQYEKFNWIVKKLKSIDINIPIKHVSNSAAIIDLPEYNLDMVRAGIMLYGLYPSKDVSLDRVNLKPAMTLKAKVSNVKNVGEGIGISYGHTYITDKETRIGTLPIGYADGFTRILSGKAEVSIKGKRVPVIGRICMDQCMVDISDIEDVKIDDEAVIFGDGENNCLHIDEVAEKLGTINYEIVCMISRRVPRVYIKNGGIINIEDYLLE